MTPDIVTHALVRPPGASFAQALSSSAARIDVALAQAQHVEYCQALVEAGLTVERLPADERYPDSCFVEDLAVVIGGQAVICRPGAPSRRGEEEAVAEHLGAQFPLARIVAPGTLEGGDVIRLLGRVVVGRSARTNRAGIAQLVVAMAELTARPGADGWARGVENLSALSVVEVPVDNYLHLQTAATYVGQNTLLVAEAYADHPAFASLDVLVVPPAEAPAANALGTGDHVILPAGYPRVAEMLRGHGFTVLLVPISEFAKADGGVTCLSLTW
jgi:dimethylargininase